MHNINKQMPVITAAKIKFMRRNGKYGTYYITNQQSLDKNYRNGMTKSLGWRNKRIYHTVIKQRQTISTRQIKATSTE
jgi:hypothetical protein